MNFLLRLTERRGLFSAGVIAAKIAVFGAGRERVANIHTPFLRRERKFLRVFYIAARLTAR
ncbi:hypothetical protein PSNIH1_p00880 (plasmid) [Pantoea sp. PSNIH1]|jgi:hypothetical protein|nr:hypothetical protein PSNIH1_p00880 [Pantoea sp. PSNIH1]